MLRRQDVDSAPIEATQETKQKVLVPALRGRARSDRRSRPRDIWWRMGLSYTAADISWVRV